MNKVNTTTAQIFQAISIGQIILDDSNYLTFWGHVKKADGWHRCDVVTTYEVLNTMLRHLEDRSDAVQMTIVNKLENMRQIPEMIDLEAELGSAIVFDNMNFKVSRLGRRNGESWVEYTKGECYYIEEATPLTPVQTRQYVKKIDHCMDMLYKSYDLYLGYLELEFDEESARLNADLADDLKYTLAYYAWKEKTM